MKKCNLSSVCCKCCYFWFSLVCQQTSSQKTNVNIHLSSKNRPWGSNFFKWIYYHAKLLCYYILFNSLSTMIELPWTGIIVFKNKSLLPDSSLEDEILIKDGFYYTVFYLPWHIPHTIPKAKDQKGIAMASLWETKRHHPAGCHFNVNSSTLAIAVKQKDLSNITIKNASYCCSYSHWRDVNNNHQWRNNSNNILLRKKNIEADTDSGNGDPLSQPMYKQFQTGEIK